MNIHPTALVDSAARIGEGAVIGPWCVIGPRAAIGQGCVIGPYAQVDWAEIGDGAQVGAKSIIGGDPQIYRWKSVDSWVKVGEGALVNEMTIVHRSMYEGGATEIGPRCYVMSQVHIGHDCALDEEVTVTTLAGLSGHVRVGPRAVIGGAAGVHQFVRIGEMAMVGGMSRIVQDVAPFFTVVGAPARAEGLNTYALKKYSIPPAERLELKRAYKTLARSGLSLAGAIEAIGRDQPQTGPVARLRAFLLESERGVTL